MRVTSRFQNVCKIHCDLTILWIYIMIWNLLRSTSDVIVFLNWIEEAENKSSTILVYQLRKTHYLCDNMGNLILNIWCCSIFIFNLNYSIYHDNKNRLGVLMVKVFLKNSEAWWYCLFCYNCYNCYHCFCLLHRVG